MKGFRQQKAFFRINLLLVGIFVAGCLADTCRGEEFDRPPHLKSLLQKAEAKQLHQEKYWWILLHYRKTFSKIESRIDDPAFFLAPKGKTDPRAELRATLTAFFAPPTPEKEHPVCRFNARFHWLAEKLDLDFSRLSISRCHSFEQVLSDLTPRSAALVFPTYHMNNPASMFGHILLKIDTGTKSDLLSQAVNYAASTTETNGLLFAFNGLFGGYRGYYAIEPYYRRIREYSDIDQRDIWEYELTLTQSEIVRMLRHLWELRGQSRKVYSDYFFLNENCAYNLLYLLEAARPSVDLIPYFPLWVLPVDIIKSVQRAGLIREVRYRPSPATRIRHQAGPITPKNRRIAVQITEGSLSVEELKTSPFSRDDKIHLLDLSAVYLKYRYTQGEIPQARYRKTLIEILRARSRLGPGEPAPDPVAPSRPDEVHEAGRITLGTGFRDGDPFLEIGYRPAFSDLLDTEFAAGQGARLEFLNTRFRYYPDDRRLALENLDLIHILSISPRDRFFRPISWKLNLGLHQALRKNGDESAIFEFNTGGGMAHSAEFPGIWFGFLEPRLQAGETLEKGYAAGIGVSAGLLTPVAKGWKSLVYVRHTYFPAGDDYQHSEVSCSQHLRLSRNHALELDLNWEKAYDQEVLETALQWHIFF
ncbi:MAG: DUF4105 domain-containing protein [Desulfococcaceae bacterium]